MPVCHITFYLFFIYFLPAQEYFSLYLYHPQLAVIIAPPCPDRTICLQYNGMPLPHKIEVTSRSFFTLTGMFLFVFVPSPNWPWSLHPQVQTVPSDFRATVWYHPAEICGFTNPGDSPLAIDDSENRAAIHQKEYKRCLHVIGMIRLNDTFFIISFASAH